ncbi:MAG TPA: hypothetical protein VGR71_15990, partial [Nitrospira sp.]|nr:hypothetical protein [Nitrospira sp.]
MKIIRKHKKLSISLLIVGAFITAFWIRSKVLEHNGGFYDAKIDPISGATLISLRYDGYENFLGDGSTIWVYKLPASYVEALYKDCASIGFKKGTIYDAGYISDIYLDPYLKSKLPACYSLHGNVKQTIRAQFVGSQLIVEEDNH